MNQTHFENPNGLDSANHYSTAKDLAILAAYAMENPIFSKTVSTRTITIGSRVLRNHNKLLWLYPEADGVKTGFTKAAGRILVSSAVRDRRRLVAVTINDPNDWADHAAMLDQGFSQYDLRRIVTVGDCVGYREVAGGTDARLLYCRWSQVRSMASKSLSRVTHSSEYLEAVNELSASARHIDEEIDFLIAKRNMDEQGLFYRDFLVSVEQGRSATFRQTRYAVIASFLKFGSPRLAQLYQMMNCSGSSSAFIDDFLPEARDLDEVDASFDEIVTAFRNGDWDFVLGFCMRLCENSNLEDSRMVNLREGILKARSFDIGRFDEQDFLALLYFSYSLRKNSK